MKSDTIHCVLDREEMRVSLGAVPALRHDISCPKLLAMVAEVVVGLFTKLLAQGKFPFQVTEVKGLERFRMLQDASSSEETY